MRKFIVFMLSVLVVFAMCSCQPAESMDGKVEFKVYTNAQASKALTATDPGKETVSSIELAFLPLEQSNVECEYKAHEATIVAKDKQSADKDHLVWAKDLIEWDTTNHTATWHSDAKLYLSQGKWTIFARALAPNGTVVLYEGQQTVYINKKNSACSITMIAKASDVTGKVILDGLTANKVFEDITKEKLTYTISGITGTSSPVSGDLLATSATGGVVTFAESPEIELNQGSYIVAVRLQQDKSDTATANWVDYTGGSIINIGVYEAATTTVSGNVETSDYIKTVPTVSISNAEFTVTIADTQDASIKVNTTADDWTYNAKFTATITKSANNPNAKTATIHWYIDGKMYTTGVTALDGALTATIEPTLAHGEHNIQAYVVGYADTTVQSTTIDAQSSVASIYGFDTATKLATN